ncbi:hypothetical protein EYF80_044265 [Liparis tanakae]|uniref:Uncharacterized protein n=1 Tax=Liparis tanakae TaxID=230148 RepID=A0A4Z2FWD6_9TELE|nr:hypothetical protein EYF80_044265 [Liparis tanakae]
MVMRDRRSWSPMSAMLTPSIKIFPLAASKILKMPRAREDFPAPDEPGLLAEGPDHAGALHRLVEVGVDGRATHGFQPPQLTGSGDVEALEKRKASGRMITAAKGVANITMMQTSMSLKT